MPHGCHGNKMEGMIVDDQLFSDSTLTSINSGFITSSGLTAILFGWHFGWFVPSSSRAGESSKVQLIKSLPTQDLQLAEDAGGCGVQHLSCCEIPQQQCVFLFEVVDILLWKSYSTTFCRFSRCYFAP